MNIFCNNRLYEGSCLLKNMKMIHRNVIDGKMCHTLPIVGLGEVQKKFMHEKVAQKKIHGLTFQPFSNGKKLVQDISPKKISCRENLNKKKIHAASDFPTPSPISFLMFHPLDDHIVHVHVCSSGGLAIPRVSTHFYRQWVISLFFSFWCLFLLPV